MNFPKNLKYTKDHEWIKLDGDIATIGITEFAQRELGDIVYVEIETAGKALEAEAVFGTVEAVKNSFGSFSSRSRYYYRGQSCSCRNSRTCKLRSIW